MGGWRDIEFDLASNSPSPVGSDASSPGATQTWLDAADMNVYGPGGVGAGDQRIVSCNDCNKPVLEGSLADHQVNCKKAKEILAGKAKANGTESRKRGLSDGSDEGSSPMVAKKLKVDKKGKAANGKEPKKRNKGPVDVNTQCGVIIGDGKPCSRSLTCKTHSMTQKRDVPGRSAPFKTLLADYQARHNAEGATTKKGAPSISITTDLTRAKPLESKKKKPIYFGEQSDSDASGDEMAAGDSEDEVEQVFAGLTAGKAVCRPMAQPTFGGAMCVRAIKYGRFRDALFGAA